jgi:hypothetical protein
MSGHDVTVRSEGSLYIFTANTIKALEYLYEHLPRDALMRRDGYAVETQYGMALMDDLIWADFTVLEL